MTQIEQILLNRVKLIEDDSWSLIGSPNSLIKELEALIATQVNQARIDELEKIMNGQKTLRSFITNDGGEEQIIIYEIDNAEIQDRLAELKGE